MAKSESSVPVAVTASASDADSSHSKPWQSYHTVYTNAKAGMEGVDKEKVQKIVYELSKGSKYFENEERKEAYMKKKIDNMRARCAKLNAANLSHYQKVVDKRMLELEASRDLSKIWLHVDMDAFYAAVETLCNPSLKGKPMAVGSMSMISTANYEARKFGVRAAMPGFIARKLCPKLIFVPVDFKKYTHYSDLTRKVFQKYDSSFLAASLDEAYLDITNVCLERGITGEEVAKELRENVYNETGLTCSAGVAPNRLLAKVCSDINKPNGQYILPNNRMAVMTFISSIPIRKIGGIGKVTESILKNTFGITTCEDMLQKSSFLCALFSRSSSDFFLSVALGLGGTNTPETRLRKSISSERTFSDTNDEAFLYKKIVDLAEMLSSDMEKEGLRGKTLTLKLKTSSFEVRTRAMTLHNYISSSDDILKYASKLLKAELPASFRLIGLRMCQFSDEKNGALSDPTQKTLSNFIVSGDSCRQSKDSSVALDSEISDDALAVDRGSDFSGDKYDACELRGSGNNNNVFDFNHGDYHLLHNDVEMGESSDIGNNNFGEEVSDPAAGDQSHMECNDEDVISIGKPCFLGEFEGSSPHKLKNMVNLENLRAGSSSYQKGLIFWVDNYKCSLCGAELPPSFIQERQEHSDFHLAEKLQEEESGDNHRILMQKQRLISRDQIVNHGKQRKKLKSSPKEERKHVPIDSYFAKASQNF